MLELYLGIMVYAGLVVWFGFEGNKRKIGWFKSMIVSLLLTPLIGFIFVFNSSKKISYFEMHYKCNRCKYEFTDHFDHCPLCEKEGKLIKLTRVKKEMT